MTDPTPGPRGTAHEPSVDPWKGLRGIMAGTLVLEAIVIGLVLHGTMYGPQAAFITEQFPARLRYAGSSLAYTFAGVVGGGMAPLIFTVLFRWTDSWVIIAAYVAVTAVATVAGMVIGRDPAPEEELELRADAPDGVDVPH